MKRQLALLAHALGGLKRRRGKSAALTAGLALVVSMFGSTLLLADALAAEVALGIDRMPDLTVQRLVAGRPALVPVAVAEELRGIPTVRRVTPRVWGYYFFGAIEANVTIVGATSAAELDEATLEGELPGADGQAAVGRGLASSLGLRVGDEIGLPVNGEVRFVRVVGVFRDRSALRTADLLVTTPGTARALLGVDAEHATDLAIELTTEDEASVVTTRVGERLPGARVLARDLLARTYQLTFSGRGGLVGALLLPALGAFLLLAWERLSGLGADERREIGVLKALGWSTSDVLASRLWESSLIGLTGAVSGLVVAYGYVFVLGAPGLWDAVLGWSALHPPMTLAPALDGAQAAAIVAFVVVPFATISVVPAWRAAMRDPDDAMRGAA